MNRPGTDVSTALKQGYALLGQGQFAHAERRARDVLAILPDSAEALVLLGISLTGQGRHKESARLFTELTRRQPKVASHWTNLGTVLRSLDRRDDALQAYARAAALGEASVDFRLNLGLLHAERGEHEAARSVLREAHRLAPLDAEIAYRYASSCYELAKLVEGVAALADWRSFQIHTTEGVVKIALLLMKLGDFESGREALDRALADPRPDPPARLQLYYALERTNRLIEARAQMDALLRERHPAVPAIDLETAHAKLLQREGRHDEAARLYRALADGRDDPTHRHFFLYPLAKTLDSAGRHDDAFDALTAAHESHTAYLEQGPAGRVGHHDDITRVTSVGCDADDVAKWSDAGAPSRGESPVFIVAFPRSGTTLLEQALDAHPQLVTMDEQPFVQATLERLSAGGASYPSRMASLTGDELTAAREHYWALVRSRVAVGTDQRLIDKNPLNILRLPAIRRLFPQAPILLAIRHPCDVILSCYLQQFRGEFAWACRDLPTLADAYVRTFDYWYQQSALLRPNVRELSYERFVADIETGLRGFAAFLDLPWHDAMLAPAEHAKRRGYISTPSYSQVVQPVHTRAIGRWRAYERHFAGILPQLRPYIDRWGYDA